MGRDFRSLQKNDNPVAESFFRLREPSFEKLVFFAINFILPQWLARRLPLRMNKVVDDETNFLRDLCQDIVSDKRQALNVSKDLVKDLEADILGTMMLGGDFSDTELVDQMLTFLAGGVSFNSNFQCSNRCVIDCIVQLVKSALKYLLTPTLLARNHRACYHMGLLPTHPTPRYPRASPL